MTRWPIGPGLALVVLALMSTSPGCANEPAEPQDTKVVPQLILPDHPEWVCLYDKAWELAAGNIRWRPEGSPMSETWIDEAFNPNVFMWDTAFIVMFARYADGSFPVRGSLDNFYRRQHDNGYICREIAEADGADVWTYNHPVAINPPLLSWAEYRLYEVTGDLARLEKVLDPLVAFYDWIAANRRWPDGTYWSTGYASGMDNTPRGSLEDVVDDHYDMAWIDMTAQQALNAEMIARIATELGETAIADRMSADWTELSALIDGTMWDEQDGLYYDLRSDGSFERVATLASFWPMVAGIPNASRCARLAEHLSDPDEFWTPHPFPTLSAAHPAYEPTGRYWRGSVWAPTNYMTIKGLERCGLEALASRATERHLTAMAAVLADTGTIWENYAPEGCDRGEPSLPDFVGWSGAGPIALLIENILGLRLDAPRGTVTWRLARAEEHGIDGLPLGQSRISVHAAARPSATSTARVTVQTSGGVTIRFVLDGQTTERTLSEGTHVITVPGNGG